MIEAEKVASRAAAKAKKIVKATKVIKTITTPVKASSKATRRRAKAKVAYGTIPDWANIRRRIIERDSYICRICGNGPEYQLNVHHKNYDRRDNADGNLVTLCADCHRQVHIEGYQPVLYYDWPEPWGNDPIVD